MRSPLALLIVSVVAAATASAVGQSPSGDTKPVAFEVASIKRSAAVIGPGYFSGMLLWPGGGLTGTNVTVAMLAARAYPPTIPADVVGLPGWAESERYNVIATSSLSTPTPDERTAMLRALMADRFHLIAHVESRGRSAYDLVLARSDRRLGPGLKAVDTDCERITAERAAAPPSPLTQPPDYSVPPPLCTFRVVGAPLRDRSGDKQGRLGDLLEGEGTMASLVLALRLFGAGRLVVDMTALSGTYRVTMNFDMAAGRGGLGVVPAPDAAPSMFTAVQEQLGLKLESKTELTEVLVIDHVERPTED